MPNSSAGTSPSEEELKKALVGLRADNPSLGIAKLHALLLAANPSWTVSEKRTRKVLQNEGLTLAPNQLQNANKDGAGQSSRAEEIFPSSKMIEGFDTTKWTPKVEVKYFSRSKGKGLVAKEKITEGEIIWKEDPFILAPEWDLYDLQSSSLACSYCSTPLRDSPIITACSSGASSSASPCRARFCNRLCLSRSARTHPLLCPSQNPASISLLAFAKKHQWMALHALAQCTARLLLTYQQDEAVWEADWKFVRSLAVLGMEDRVKTNGIDGAEVDRETWRRGYQLYVQAFHEPTTPSDKKKLARLLRKPSPKELVDEMFNYDGSLLGLGRMSLNIEAHGGIYVLHSHINHSCSPNVSARHLDQRTALSRLTVIAKKDVEPGEELFITYVNPDLPVELRRRQLMEWGFGICQCPRCVAEAGDSSRHAGSATLDDLELELKAGLGVI